MLFSISPTPEFAGPNSAGSISVPAAAMIVVVIIVIPSASVSLIGTLLLKLLTPQLALVCTLLLKLLSLLRSCKALRLTLIVRKTASLPELATIVVIASALIFPAIPVPASAPFTTIATVIVAATTPLLLPLAAFTAIAVFSLAVLALRKRPACEYSDASDHQ